MFFVVGPQLLIFTSYFAYDCPGSDHHWNNATCKGIQFFKVSIHHNNNIFLIAQTIEQGETWERQISSIQPLNGHLALWITPSLTVPVDTVETLEDTLHSIVDVYGRDEASGNDCVCYFWWLKTQEQHNNAF
jgi:hypothetical protein